MFCGKRQMRFGGLRTIIALALASAGTNGCAIVKASYHVAPVVVPTRPSCWDRFTTRVRDCLSGDPYIEPIALGDYDFPDQPKSDEGDAYKLALQSKSARNRLAQQIVARSNEMCVAHLSGFVAQDAMNELALGMSSLGLTAAGSVVPGVAAATSAAATGVGGLRTLINDAIYYKQLSPALVALVVAERAKLLTVVSAKLQVNSLGEDLCDATEWQNWRGGSYPPDHPPVFTITAPGATCPPTPAASGMPESTPKPPPADGRRPANKKDAGKPTPEATKTPGPFPPIPCPHAVQPDIQAALDELKAAKDAARVAAKQPTQTPPKSQKPGSTPTATPQDPADSLLNSSAQNVGDKTKAAQKAQDEYSYCRPWIDYSIDDVIDDLTAYNDTCSFYYALQLASDKIKESAADINKDLDTIYKNAKKDAQSGNQPATKGASDTHAPTDSTKASKP